MAPNNWPQSSAKFWKTLLVIFFKNLKTIRNANYLPSLLLAFIKYICFISTVKILELVTINLILIVNFWKINDSLIVNFD